MAEKQGLNALLTALQDKYGDEVTTADKLAGMRKILLKNPAFDYASDGGIPINRITELIGEFSSTKTLHMLFAAREFQHYDWANDVQGAFSQIIYEDKKTKNGTIKLIKDVKLRKGYRPKLTPKAKRVAVIDVEGTFDPSWAEKQGVDVEGIIIVRPSSLESAVDITEALLSDSDICLVLFDSMQAVGSQAETDKSMEDEQMAANARFWNKAMRKLQNAINKNEDADVTLIAVNGFYDKVGFVMGDPMVIKNGQQMKFAKSLSMYFRPLKPITEKFEGEDTVVGRNVNITNLKSKVGTPFRKSTFYLQIIDDEANGLSAGSIDTNRSLLELGIRFGFVMRSGAWFEYKGKKCNGMDALLTALDADPELLLSLNKDVYGRIEKRTDT